MKRKVLPAVHWSGDPASESVNGSLPMVEQPSELLWQNLIVTHNIDRISYLEKNRMANPMQSSDQQYQSNIPVIISEYKLSLFVTLRRIKTWEGF